MLQNWLQPIDDAVCPEPTSTYRKVGHRLVLHTQSGGIPKLSGVQVALIGTDPKSAAAFRRHFYRLAYPFTKLKIADLGDLRKPNIDFCIGALAEIRNAGMLPVLIGSGIEGSQALFRAMMINYQSINLVVVDETIPLDPLHQKSTNPYLNPIVFGSDNQVFQLGLIGYQIHFVDPEVQKFLRDQTFDLVRLGDARAQIQEVEPIIRDADLFGIHLTALRGGEAPAVAVPSPSGFLVEEACQMARYAGMSDKLKGFYLLGYAPEKDPDQHTAFVMAEIVWYFLDGLYHRKGDFPVSTEGLTEYIVELKKYNYTLTFWKSKYSGRWWLQVPVKVRRRHERHRLLPCSYQDYRAACRDELPDRLINAFKRFA